MAPAFPAAVQYAGFWRRFAAALIDALILGLIMGAVTAAIQFILVATGVLDPEAAQADTDSVEYARYVVVVYGLAGVTLLARLIYFVLMESSSRQASLGKMVLGIVVTDSAGRRISSGRALGRNLTKLFFEVTFIIGLVNAIVIAATDKKQGLHDLIASTLVVVKK